MKKNILKYKTTYLGWLTCFFCFFVLNLLFGKKIEDAPAWCDYTLYWELGKSLFRDGAFSLVTLSNPLRGTILPMLYGGMYYIGTHLFASETMGYILGSSILYSILYALLIPKFIKQMGFKSDFGVIGGVLALSFVFWYGIFLYPLSDVLAFLMTLGACCLLQRQQSIWGIKKILYGIGVGICIYSAYNIRSVYLFAGYVIAVAIVVQNIKKPKALLSIALGTLCGISIAAVPQIIINKTFFDIWSIKNVASSSIILSQLRWGLEMQRYETYVGEIGKSEGMYPNYGLVFEDPIGTALISKTGLEKFNSLGEYFGFCFKYFFDVIGIYVRHLYNALCPCFPELYIEDLHRNKVVLSIINSVIFYFGGYTLLYALAYKFNSFIIVFKKNFLYCLAIVIPALASIPGAIELRFFYPVYMLVYMLVLVGIRNKGIIESFKKKWYIHLACFIVILMPIWALWGETFAKLRYMQLLFTT